MRMAMTFEASKCRSQPKYTTMITPMKASRMRMNFPWVIRYVLQVS